MTRETWSYAGTRAVVGFSGFTGVASHLSTVFGVQVSKQLVWISYRRRETTFFPEKRTIVVGDREMQLFNLDEVADWYRAHRQVPYGSLVS